MHIRSCEGKEKKKEHMQGSACQSGRKPLFSRTDVPYFIMGEVYVSLVFTVGYEAMGINKLRMPRVVNKICRFLWK